VNVEQRKEYNDLWMILQHMDKAKVDLLPERYLAFVEKAMVPGWKTDIDPDIPIDHQPISSKTRDVLACLNLTYWARSPQERREFAEGLNANERAYAAKEPGPMTEAEYQDLLEVFDDWNDMFGPIPFWSESRGR
jgi:hypothetical protein